MRLQYLTDSKGKYTGVFIPIKDWEAIKDKLKGVDIEELNMEKASTDKLLAGVKDALDEVKNYTLGKVKLQTAEDFLDEL